ncbi:MAG: hypothetical protein VYD47_05605, partial [Actinomycetota bacterium]|nr:hypothetical protein [Actinomycetota bacterium]
NGDDEQASEDQHPSASQEADQAPSEPEASPDIKAEAPPEIEVATDQEPDGSPDKELHPDQHP